MNQDEDSHMIVILMKSKITQEFSHDCDAQLIQERVVLAVSKVYDRVDLLGRSNGE